MRPVDYRPDDLANVEALDKLRDDVNAAENDEERSKIIEKNGAAWAAIKPQLRDVFHRKCWYTESLQAGTDVDVDHFRPKGRVAESTDKNNPHPGYWWLAFSPSNYRYSCIVANRLRKDVDSKITGGKADHFPLVDEGKRAWSSNCDLELEEPVLIDPCRSADVSLIAFKEDGEAMPRFSKDKKPKLYNRAHQSILLYNINHGDFTKARQGLRDKMTKLINDARKAFCRLENDEADQFHTDSYETAISDLRSLRDLKAPYSGFCVAFLDTHRDDEFLSGVFL